MQKAKQALATFMLMPVQCKSVIYIYIGSRTDGRASGSRSEGRTGGDSLGKHWKARKSRAPKLSARKANQTFAYFAKCQCTNAEAAATLTVQTKLERSTGNADAANDG